MGDERAMVYLVVGFLAVLALVTRLAFILVASLNPDSFENSFQSSNIPYLAVTMISTALGFVMLSFKCKQRRKFVEHQNQDEAACASIFAIWCCSPCAYGQ